MIASIRRRLLLASSVLAGAVFAACSTDDPTDLGSIVEGEFPQNSLNPAGPQARQIDDLFWLVFWIAVVVFVLVMVALLYAIVRYRHREGKDRPVKQVHGNTRLEIVWTIIPAVILAVIAVPTVSTIFDLRSEPDPGDNALQVEVIGHQWWWEFRYPEYGFSTANEMHIPTDRPVYLSITSVDVIHSFWVPQLNGKRDAVPGRITHLTLQADEPGWYLGQCAEFCGLAHADMRHRVRADEEAVFQAWAMEQAQPAAVPTEGLAAEGWEIFQTVCAACHAVDGTAATANLAPNLTHFASRTSFGGATFANTEAHLREWLRDPSALKPMDPDRNDLANGRVLGMPNFGLTEEQIDGLIALLETLK
ncbi:MAG TPA: cytochrome c oxidase subunit II [Acidimicrobiia bacterium]|nr:cytochrome c oxidase subunit II [Acidimicrobiia bacterium]